MKQTHAECIIRKMLEEGKVNDAYQFALENAKQSEAWLLVAVRILSCIKKLNSRKESAQS